MASNPDIMKGPEQLKSQSETLSVGAKQALKFEPNGVQPTVELSKYSLDLKNSQKDFYQERNSILGGNSLLPPKDVSRGIPPWPKPDDIS